MEMNKTKRAQAALEFLTTYGWAFLVILIMIGALAYFGVLNPSNLVPDTCTAGDGFICTEYIATADEEQNAVQIILINSLEGITFNATTMGTSINVTETGSSLCTAPTLGGVSVDGDAWTTANGAWVVESGQTLQLDINCSVGLAANDRFVGEVELTYTPVGKTLPKTLSVDVSVKAK